ncbi:hypothetical protein DUI87_06992 [Hirundo rustica rustica]|uniref:Uncharacterized protein n=1 Tax=Hirundo rustica rustica TaxID=333673 RepID=A0A3M0KP47_HIRRU|nr:hypothetical protein DUI87_06992 [Hirundo rustica rustica]
MTKRQKVNADYKSREGQPLLSKRRQVRDGDGGRGCSGTWRRAGGRELQPGLAPGLALGMSWCQNGLAEGIAQRQRAQLGTQPSLAAVLCICLGARAGLADVRKDSVPTRSPPSPTSSCFPQVLQRLPQAAAEVTWVTVTPLYMDRLVLRPFTSLKPTGCGTQEGSLECGHSLPHSGTVTQPPRLSVSDLSPLHGPPLTVTPLCWLSPEMPRAASARVKMPPLPAAPAASGSSPTSRAWSTGPVARGYRDLVPTSPWGTMAADGAWLTPTPESSAEGLRQGSGARQGHGLSPLRCEGDTPHRTGTQLAWKHLGHTETQELIEVQGEHGGKTSKDLIRGLAPCLHEDTSIKSNCTQEQSRFCQVTDAEPEVLPSTPSLTKCSTGEMGNSSELLSPGLIAEPFSVSDDLQLRDIFLEESEEEWEDEGLPDTAAPAAGDRCSDRQSVSLASWKEKKAEAAASAVARDLSDKGHSELFPTSEPEETSGFPASLSSGGPCEDRRTHWLAEQSTHGMLLCRETGDDSKPLLQISAEELGKLEEDILSTFHEESILVPHSLSSLTNEGTGETEKYSHLVSPDLFEELWSLFNNRDMPSWDTHADNLLAKWEEEELPDTDSAGEEDNEPKSSLCPPMQDKVEPTASRLDSDPCDEGHSELLLMAPPKESKMLACTFSANTTEEADATCVDAGHAQARLDQENPCSTGMLAGPSRVPAQTLACSVSSSSTDVTTVLQPPAPRRWSSILKTARRALSRLFSFSCRSGQREE